MNRLSKHGIPLLENHISALRVLVAEMPPTVVAQALGYTAECTPDHAAMVGTRWAGYAGRRRGQ